eukprot:15257216-Heterocapsa_arctica.AAC.1
MLGTLVLLIICVAIPGSSEMIMVQGMEKVCPRVGWCMLEWISLSCAPWCPWQQLNVTLRPAIACKTEAEHVESRRLLCEVTLALRMSEHLYMAIEWPWNALTWSLPPLELLRLMPLKCEFDNGLRVRVQINAFLQQPLSRCCSDDHVHYALRGQEALLSNTYTDERVDVIDDVFVRRAGTQATIEET